MYFLLRVLPAADTKTIDLVNHCAVTGVTRAKLMLSPLLQSHTITLDFVVLSVFASTVSGMPSGPATQVIKDKVELILLLAQINISP